VPGGSQARAANYGAAWRRRKYDDRIVSALSAEYDADPGRWGSWESPQDVHEMVAPELCGPVLALDAEKRGWISEASRHRDPARACAMRASRRVRS
jgi:hypothetical protein